LPRFVSAAAARSAGFGNWAVTPYQKLRAGRHTCAAGALVSDVSHETAGETGVMHVRGRPRYYPERPATAPLSFAGSGRGERHVELAALVAALI
jgi:hypothetical protein